MRKALSLFMALLMMTGFAAGIQGGAAAQGSPSGTSIIDSSGIEVATVTIDSITDPFDGYAAGYEPQRGFRYVLLTVTVENLSDAPYYVQPYGFVLVDGDGFISTQAYITYDEGVAESALADTQLEASDSVTGAVAFQILADADVSAITYAPAYDRNYVLASSAGAGEATGPTPILGEDGSQLGTLTIEEITDPLADVDPSYPAPRGYHYLGVEVTIENTSSRPLSVDPSRLRIYDSEGFVNSYYGAYRTAEATEALPDIQYADLAPGDSITGLISFSVFNTATPAFLVWTDSYTQFQIVSIFEGAAAIPVIDDIPAGASVSVSTPAVDETAVVEETATESADLSPECQDLQDWSDELNVAITDLNSLATSIDTLEDLEALTPDEINEQVDLLNDFLDEIEEIDTPDAAEGTYDALVDLIETQIDGFDAVADAKDDGDDLQPIYDEYQTKVDDASNAFFDEAATLDELCPALS